MQRSALGGRRAPAVRRHRCTLHVVCVALECSETDACLGVPHTLASLSSKWRNEIAGGEERNRHLGKQRNLVQHCVKLVLEMETPNFFYWCQIAIKNTSEQCEKQTCRRQQMLVPGWRLSCTASGPQLHGSLGSTGLRPMTLQYSQDLEHGPGAGSRLLPWLPLLICSLPVSGVGLGLFVMRLPCCGFPSLHPSSITCVATRVFMHSLQKHKK